MRWLPNFIDNPYVHFLYWATNSATSSIIPGYEYDIFISYRQKDNKYDGWVTEFINHLKDELEATFKEDISIYFDENPQSQIEVILERNSLYGNLCWYFNGNQHRRNKHWITAKLYFCPKKSR